MPADDNNGNREELIEMIAVALSGVTNRQGRLIRVPNAIKHATTIADAMLSGEREEIVRLKF